MTVASTIFLVAAVVFAVLNWTAVARTAKWLEYISKPATAMSFLLTAAFLDVPHSATWWLRLGALFLCIFGDVFLMLPRNAFLQGLVSFAIGQVLFALSFIADGVEAPLSVVGLIVVLPFAFVLARRFVTALRSRGMNELIAPVVVYLIIISAMAVTSIGNGSVLAAIGAIVFMASDSLIAESRFVRSRPWHSVGIMVTYHCALAGLTLSLL